MENRIKKLRKKLNLTLKEFGNRIGKSLQAIQHYEAGRNKVDDTTVMLISKTFNVNEAWLRTGEGEMFSPIDLDIKKYLRPIEENNTDKKSQFMQPHERLILLRKTFESLQLELWETLGKKPQEIQGYESGKVNLGNLSWELLEHFNVNPFWLMMGQGQMVVTDDIDFKNYVKKNKNYAEENHSKNLLKEKSLSYRVNEAPTPYGNSHPESNKLSMEKEKAIKYIKNLDEPDVRIVLAYIEGIAAERTKLPTNRLKNELK